MSGTFDKAKGKVEEAVGTAKQKLGDATDNHSLEAEGVKDQLKGKAHQAEGEIKERVDDARDRAHDHVHDHDER